MDHSLEIRCDYSVTKIMNQQEKIAYLQSLCDVSLAKQNLENSYIKNKLPAFSLGMIQKAKNNFIIQRMKIITQYDKKLRASNGLMMVFGMLFGIFFISSFAFVVQPYSEVIYDEETVFSEDSYAIDLKNGDVRIHVGIDAYGDEETFVCHMV